MFSWVHADQEAFVASAVLVHGRSDGKNRGLAPGG
jgi:hypothetical protein